MKPAYVLALVVPLVSALPMTSEMGTALSEREAYVPPVQRPGDCLIRGKSCVLPTINHAFAKIKSFTTGN
ncbi:MAG: hypothetical protein MMC23_001311 [Stictis urceolatum]|nr:hypothetical protein [Stictis urceolata]